MAKPQPPSWKKGIFLWPHFEEDEDQIVASFKIGIQKFDKQMAVEFGKIADLWAKKIFTPALKKAAASSMWVRSGRLAENVGARLTNVRAFGQNGVSYTVSAEAPGAEDHMQTQETGRADTTGPPSGGKMYLVPLATWVIKNGRAGKDRNWMTRAEITRDLAQPGVFMPKKTIDTKAGPARMILLRHKGGKRYLKNQRTGRFMKMSKGPKPRLREVATAMYLAYSGYTGVYGASHPKFARRVSAPKEPLAANFGLTKTTKAPQWFTRGASSSLRKLYDAVLAVNAMPSKKSSKKPTDPEKLAQDIYKEIVNDLL